MRGRQIDIFKDGISVFAFWVDEIVCLGTYYCYEKANKELVNNLSRGLCAWMKFNERETESRGLQKYKNRGSCSMETLG